MQAEVAGAQDQRDGGHDEVAVLAEVHLVVHPEACAGHGDEAEHHDGHAAQHGRRDGGDGGAELGREAQQDGGQRCNHEDQRGIDAGDGHHADVLGIGGDARAACRARNDGGHAVTDEGASDGRVQVAARHGRHGLDVPQVLGHQHQRHRGDQQDGPGLEGRRGELRQAHPGGLRHRGEVDGRAQAQHIGQHPVQHIRHHQPHQDEELLDGPACEHRHQAHAQRREQRHPAVELVGTHALDHDRRQVQADDGHHRTRHHRRHQPLDPSRAHRIDQQPDQHIDHAAGDDAAQRHRQVAIGPHARIAGGGNHHTDERKAGPQVAGHPAAHHQEEQQRAHTRHQDGDVRVKAHQQRRQHRGAEHGHHVLKAHGHHLGPGQALIGGNHPLGLQRPVKGAHRRVGGGSLGIG